MGKIKFGKKVYFIYMYSNDHPARIEVDGLPYMYFGRTTSEESAKRICEEGGEIEVDGHREPVPVFIYDKEFIK